MICYSILFDVLAMYRFQLATVSDFLCALHYWSGNVSPSKLRELMSPKYISTVCFNTILRSYVWGRKLEVTLGIIRLMHSSMRRKTIDATACIRRHTVCIPVYHDTQRFGAQRKNASVSVSCFGIIYSPIDQHYGRGENLQVCA